MHNLLIIIFVLNVFMCIAMVACNMNRNNIKKTLVVTIIFFVFSLASILVSNYAVSYIEALEKIIDVNQISIPAILSDSSAVNAQISIDVIIGLLGLVIAIWGGVTIYNAVKENDIEKLKEKTEDEFNKYRNYVSENNLLHKEYLYCAFDISDTSSLYFNKMLTETDMDYTDFDFMSSAISIEYSFSKAYDLFRSNEYEKMDLFIEYGLKKISTLENHLKYDCKECQEKNRLTAYVLYRKSDLVFYKALKLYYFENNPALAVETMYKAVHSYIKALKLDDNLETQSDAYNSLGIAYQQITTFSENGHLKVDSKTTERACYYCRLAVSVQPGNFLVLKNMGVALEQNGEFDNAISYYKKSLKIKPTYAKTVLCLISVNLKATKKILGVSEARDNLMCNIKPSDEQIAEAQKYMDEAKKFLELGAAFCCEYSNLYYKEGEYLTYCYLINNDSNVRKDIYEKALKSFENAERFSINNNSYMFFKRNFYEAVGDKNMAVEINNKLNTGDSDVIKKLYNAKKWD